MELEFPVYEDHEADDLAAFLSTGPWPYHLNVQPELATCGEWISSGRFTGELNHTVWITDRGERVGLIAIHELNDYTPTFDLRVRKDRRGQGIGRRALAWLARDVFERIGKHRVEGHTRADNLAMQRAFRASGWVQEAYYRQAWPDEQGRFYDALAFALLRQDWESGESTPVARLESAPA